jgi:hypothetical protein
VEKKVMHEVVGPNFESYAWNQVIVVNQEPTQESTQDAAVSPESDGTTTEKQEDTKLRELP